MPNTPNYGWTKPELGASYNTWGEILNALFDAIDEQVKLVEAEVGGAGALVAASNLSDLTDVPQARSNLGLGTAAQNATGDFLQKTNNLSDLTNQATARSNLGLGTAAQNATGDFDPAGTAAALPKIQTAIYDPDIGSSSGIRYKTWAEVMTALSAMDGFKHLIIHKPSILTTISISSGTYNFENVILSATRDTLVPILSFADGTTFSKFFLAIRNQVVVKGNNTSAPVFTCVDTTSVIYVDFGSLINAGSQVLVSIPNGKEFAYFMRNSSRILNNSNLEIFDIAATGKLNLQVYDFGIIETRTIKGSGTLQIDDFTLKESPYTGIGTQTNFSGTLNYTAHSEARLIEILPKYAQISDTKTNGTSGQSLTGGSWTTRDLNTEDYDSDNIVSISSNQFTLIAGTYLIDVSAPAQAVAAHRIKLYNISDSVDVYFGQNAYAEVIDSVTTNATLSTKITIATSKTFEIRHKVTTTDPGGITNSFGTTEQYTVVKICKIA